MKYNEETLIDEVPFSNRLKNCLRSVTSSSGDIKITYLKDLKNIDFKNVRLRNFGELSKIELLNFLNEFTDIKIDLDFNENYKLKLLKENGAILLTDLGFDKKTATFLNKFHIYTPEDLIENENLVCTFDEKIKSKIFLNMKELNLKFNMKLSNELKSKEIDIDIKKSTLEKIKIESQKKLSKIDADIEKKYRELEIMILKRERVSIELTAIDKNIVKLEDVKSI